MFGDELRCVSGDIRRLGKKVNVGGASVYPDTGDSSISARGVIGTFAGVAGFQ